SPPKSPLFPPNSHFSPQISIIFPPNPHFFDAGIPPGPALGYAVAFVDNRIHKNMLLDLTKELMKELGITVVGDVIAILRHAKVVHRQVCAGRPRSRCSRRLRPSGARGAPGRIGIGIGIRSGIGIGIGPGRPRDPRAAPPGG
uniref:Uncharacterized protein n=1 Tax=Corvus moneduloides TaxID=1196302 RepID=A0A8U7NYJ6_CORMO